MLDFEKMIVLIRKIQGENGYVLKQLRKKGNTVIPKDVVRCKAINYSADKMEALLSALMLERVTVRRVETDFFIAELVKQEETDA